MILISVVLRSHPPVNFPKEWSLLVCCEVDLILPKRACSFFFELREEHPIVDSCCKIPQSARVKLPVKVLFFEVEHAPVIDEILTSLPVFHSHCSVFSESVKLVRVFPDGHPINWNVVKVVITVPFCESIFGVCGQAEKDDEGVQEPYSFVVFKQVFRAFLSKVGVGQATQPLGSSQGFPGWTSPEVWIPLEGDSC